VARQTPSASERGGECRRQQPQRATRAPRDPVSALIASVAFVASVAIVANPSTRCGSEHPASQRAAEREHTAGLRAAVAKPQHEVRVAQRTHGTY
jgi:hypothetical protein